jgi:hypothetical protein
MSLQLQEIRLQPQLPDRRETVHLFRFAHLQRPPSPTCDCHFQVSPGHIGQVLSHQQKAFRRQRKLSAQGQLAQLDQRALETLRALDRLR